MNHRTQLKLKCNGYLRQGHLVLAVTLSTYVKSDRIAHSDRMRHMWDQHFIRRVERCLPYRAALDHDYVLEESSDRNWHYHGLLAVRSEFAYRLWKQDRLNPRLDNDVKSFAKAGRYRPFCINSFLIEPIDNPDAWCQYITKQRHSLLG
jgi:hypothetical protein